ncbi:MAG TPA: hypothetical protein VFU08_01320 [Candidatus Udaeobacter sp.]|nr:hypothetical protein [Candidatus Udaeobacter sp.]
MSPSEFMGGSFQHLSRKCAPIEVRPQALTRQLIDADGFCAGCKGAKTIAIEHSKTLYLPSLPVVHIAPETDRYPRHAEIQIAQISQLLAVSVAPLNYHSPSPTDPLGNRTEF